MTIRRRPPGTKSGPGWIRLGTEPVMWQPEFRPEPLSGSEDDWRITTYDVL